MSTLGEIVEAMSGVSEEYAPSPMYDNAIYCAGYRPRTVRLRIHKVGSSRGGIVEVVVMRWALDQSAGISKLIGDVRALVKGIENHA